MRKSFWAASLLLLAGTAAGKSAPSTFPQSYELFPRLLADPRLIQVSAAYYRQDGYHVGDTALGHSWGIQRWYSGQDSWIWQWDLEAMAYSKFRMSGSVNHFETIDFFVNVPLEAKRGNFSAKAMAFHQSSHLGDDYIRRTHDAGFRYSIDGLRGWASYNPHPLARGYAGATGLLHTIPSRKRLAVQWGLELKSPVWKWDRYPMNAYFAQDLQSLQNVKWNVNSRSVLGLRLGFQETVRAARFYVGYFTGHSPYGQFFFRQEHYADVGIALEL